MVLLQVHRERGDCTFTVGTYTLDIQPSPVRSRYEFVQPVRRTDNAAVVTVICFWRFVFPFIDAVNFKIVFAFLMSAPPICRFLMPLCTWSVTPFHGPCPYFDTKLLAASTASPYLLVNRALFPATVSTYIGAFDDMCVVGRLLASSFD